MKKITNLSIGVSLLFLVILNQTVIAKDFSDVQKSNAHYVSIDYLSNKNILTGYSDGTFKSDQLVNRAEALKIILEGLAVKVGNEVDVNKLFVDVKANDWFAKYVVLARNKGIINGNSDGTFAAGRPVARAEFLKMLLETVGFKKETWANQQLFTDVPKGSWYAVYLNYAGKSGIIAKNKDGKVFPESNLNRGEVADILYLMLTIVNSKDTEFLLTQSDAQIAQIENYLAANDVAMAKRSSDLAVDMTQQAMKAKMGDQNVLAKAKIAKAYAFLIDAFINALKKDYSGAKTAAEAALAKADEAWEVDHGVQVMARHIKDKAQGIWIDVNNK